MSDNTAIRVENVSMKFNLSRERIDSLKEYVVKAFKRQLFYDEFWALNDVSFEVKKGEVFALMGFNGAGKSTLLKIVAGVFKPTKGNVRVEGLIAPLIELGAGFDFEFTARENVYMNGAMFGYPPSFMETKYDEIIDFAELRDFEDVPVKNFSSGMIARLGFSIATTVEPEVLIADEILGVGDYKFQEKSQERIKKMINNGVTVLLVSHTVETVKKMCSRALLLDKGNVAAIGTVDEVCEVYRPSRPQQ
jgi:ABC-type polysaccharide/polyol phosphate transport system ATPase subunit